MSGKYPPFQHWQDTDQRPACPDSASHAQGMGMVRLTRREHEILHLLEMRRTNREIAEILSISVRTVECHVQGILAKLGAPNRRAAVAFEPGPVLAWWQHSRARAPLKFSPLPAAGRGAGGEGS